MGEVMADEAITRRQRERHLRGVRECGRRFRERRAA